jgi:hypothetical protein
VTTDGIRVGSSCLNDPDRGGQLIHVASSSSELDQELAASAHGLRDLNDPVSQ